MSTFTSHPASVNTPQFPTVPTVHVPQATSQVHIPSPHPKVHLERQPAPLSILVHFPHNLSPPSTSTLEAAPKASFTRWQAWHHALARGQNSFCDSHLHREKLPPFHTFLCLTMNPSITTQSILERYTSPGTRSPENLAMARTQQVGYVKISSAWPRCVHLP